jgi:hypothetical protein
MKSSLPVVHEDVVVEFLADGERRGQVDLAPVQGSHQEAEELERVVDQAWVRRAERGAERRDPQQRRRPPAGLFLFGLSRLLPQERGS